MAAPPTDQAHQKRKKGRKQLAATASSEAQFRDQLYTSFQEKGVVRSLKSQLRTQLASDLLRSTKPEDVRERSHRRSKHHQTAADTQRQSLPSKVADSLLLEYLQLFSYEYTLSVFSAESGMRYDQVLALEDTRKLLGLPEAPPGGKDLTKLSRTGALVELIGLALMKQAAQCHSKEIQTDEVPRKQLAERMADLEVSFSHRQSTLESGMEEQMLSFQNKCRQQCQDELLRYKAQFAAGEMAKTQTEERRRYDDRLQSLREEHNKQYRNKLDALNIREQESKLSQQKRQQDLEGEMYRQRQLLLEQIERLQKKEAEVQQSASNNEQKLKDQLSCLERDREQLNRDQLQCQRETDNFQQRLQAEVQRCQVRLEQELQEKTVKLELLQSNVTNREHDLAERSKTFERLSTELESVRERLLDTQEKLHRAVEDRRDAIQQRDHLQGIYAEVKDYQAMKERIALLQRELESANRRSADTRDALRQQQEGHEAIVKELSCKLSLASPEAALLKDELKHTRDEMHRQSLVAKETQKMLMQRLEHESQRSDHVSQRFQELQIHEKALLLEIEDLKRLLRQAETAIGQPTVGSNRQRITHPYQLASGLATLGLTSSEASGEDTRSRQSRPKSQRLSSSMRKSKLAPPASSMKTVETAFDANDTTASLSDHWSLETDGLSHRNYFQELEKEAEDLEKSYKDFQLRLENQQPGYSYSAASNPEYSLHRDGVAGLGHGSTMAGLYRVKQPIASPSAHLGVLSSSSRNPALAKHPGASFHISQGASGLDASVLNQRGPAPATVTMPDCVQTTTSSSSGGRTGLATISDTIVQLPSKPPHGVQSKSPPKQAAAATTNLQTHIQPTTAQLPYLAESRLATSTLESRAGKHQPLAPQSADIELSEHSTPIGNGATSTFSPRRQFQSDGHHYTSSVLNQSSKYDKKTRPRRSADDGVSSSDAAEKQRRKGRNSSAPLGSADPGSSSALAQANRNKGKFEPALSPDVGLSDSDTSADHSEKRTLKTHQHRVVNGRDANDLSSGHSSTSPMRRKPMSATGGTVVLEHALPPREDVQGVASSSIASAARTDSKPARSVPASASTAGDRLGSIADHRTSEAESSSTVSVPGIGPLSTAPSQLSPPVQRVDPSALSHAAEPVSRAGSVSTESSLPTVEDRSQLMSTISQLTPTILQWPSVSHDVPVGMQAGQSTNPEFDGPTSANSMTSLVMSPHSQVSLPDGAVAASAPSAGRDQHSSADALPQPVAAEPTDQHSPALAASEHGTADDRTSSDKTKHSNAEETQTLHSASSHSTVTIDDDDDSDEPVVSLDTAWGPSTPARGLSARLRPKVQTPRSEPAPKASATRPLPSAVNNIPDPGSLTERTDTGPAGFSTAAPPSSAPRDTALTSDPAENPHQASHSNLDRQNSAAHSQQSTTDSASELDFSPVVASDVPQATGKTTASIDVEAERKRLERLQQEREEEERMLAEQAALAALEQENEQEQATSSIGAGSIANRKSTHSSISELSFTSQSSAGSQAAGDTSEAGPAEASAGAGTGDGKEDGIDSSMLAYMQMIKDKKSAGTNPPAQTPSSAKSTETLLKPFGEEKAPPKDGQEEDYSLPEDSMVEEGEGWDKGSDNDDFEW